MSGPEPMRVPIPSRRKLFTSFRDIPFWIRSARTDSLLRRLREAQSNEEAFEQIYKNLRDPWLSTEQRYRYQPLKYRIMLYLDTPGLGVLVKDDLQLLPCRVRRESRRARTGPRCCGSSSAPSAKWHSYSSAPAKVRGSRSQYARELDRFLALPRTAQES